MLTQILCFDRFFVAIEFARKFKVFTTNDIVKYFDPGKSLELHLFWYLTSICFGAKI